MDVLYYLCYYLTLFLTPFVFYIVFLNRNQSFNPSKDLFYFVKYYYAKKAVKQYQEKYNKLFKSIGETFDVQIDFPKEKHVNSQYFFGTDQKGNSLSIRIYLRKKNIAEAFLCLRLSNGKVYAFPGDGKIIETNISKHQWKVNGLNIEVLEPYKGVRVVFNGFLQNVSVEDCVKVEHVAFRFIFHQCGAPTFFPHEMDTNLFAKSFAIETWRDGSWKDNFVKQFGYEQFGTLQGFVRGEAFSEDLRLNLCSSRSKFCGISDRHLTNRELRLFIADDYGNLINVVLKSFKNGLSRFTYGSVILSDNTILTLKNVDISLKDVAECKCFPEVITTHIEFDGKVFRCVLHLNLHRISKFTNGHKYGYDCYEIPAECDVNGNQGTAIVQFWYHGDGETKYKAAPLLCEQICDDLPKTLVCNIKSEESLMLGLTGGKGNSLALLASLNSSQFSIPDGFIITTNSFKKQVESCKNLQDSINFLDDVCCGRKDGKLEESCEKTVELFKSTKILPEISEAVVEELAKIRDSDSKDGNDFKAWAVRSSAVGEDSEDLSAAGQNETFLGLLTVEQILEAVSKCWASLFAHQSVRYRWQHGLPVKSDMAVVVQEMVAADCAGVLFTCHPSTCDPSKMVITSNYGLGESVVSGKSDPDTLILNRSFDGRVTLIERRIGTKNKVLFMGEKGVEEKESENFDDAGNRQNWSLNESQALDLGLVGVNLEKAFGGPRDIEWAFYKEKLHLLQSRPITTLNSWSDYELTHELDGPVRSDKLVLTVANTGEVFPNGLTVLSQTSSLPIVDRSLQVHTHGYYDRFVLNGVTTFQHNVMLDVVNALHKNVMSEVTLSSTILDLAIFGHPVLDEKINEIAIERRGVLKGFQRVREPLRILNCARRNRLVYEEARTVSDRLRVGFCVGGSDGLDEIYGKIGKLQGDLMGIGLAHTITSSVSVFYQIVAMNVLVERNKELSTDHYTDFALMLSSCDDVISAEIPRYLENIAKAIRDEGLEEEFCNLDPKSGVEWLKNSCPKAYRIFEEFIEKHGHRNIGEFEMMEESWEENPTTVVPMIQANAKHGGGVNKDKKSVSEIISALKSPKSGITRSILKFLMNKITSSVGIRELTKSELIRSLNKLRQSYRILAVEMAKEGLLPSKDLIYHLTHYEIGQVIRRSNPLLITKASKRQKLFPTWSKLKFPEVMFGEPIAESDDQVFEVKGDVVKGTPVCAGTVKARACVISSLDEINELKTGDVLITYSTDIGWSPYFPMLSGIVTELGGLVSHGAVVAREYGLPCIVGVRNATKLFKTGETVVLSGDKGELGKV